MNLRTFVTSVLLGGTVLAPLSVGVCGEAPQEALVAALSVQQETVCTAATAQEISASIAFANQTKSNILVKPAGGRNLTVHGLFSTRTLKPLLSSWTSMSDQGSRERSPNITLRPGETNNYPLRFKLPAKVLSEPGFYKVQVSYSAIDEGVQSVNRDGETNWVILQVRNCER